MPETILITGASTGIGKVTAKHFQSNGWNVIATMRTPEKETELSGLDRVLVTRLDVTDSASIETAVAEGIAKFGGIDVLMNNAGYGAYGPLEAFPMDNIRKQFDTNVIGLLEVTKAVLPHFRTRKSGIIVNISSIGGRMTFPLGTLYHGTKFAVEGLSEARSSSPRTSRTSFGLRSDRSKNKRTGAFGSTWATMEAPKRSSRSATNIESSIWSIVDSTTTWEAPR